MSLPAVGSTLAAARVLDERPMSTQPACGGLAPPGGLAAVLPMDRRSAALPSPDPFGRMKLQVVGATDGVLVPVLPVVMISWAVWLTGLTALYDPSRFPPKSRPNWL